MTPQAPLAVLLSPRRAVVLAARRVGARTLVLAPDLSSPSVREAVAAADSALTVEWRDHPRLMMAIGHLAHLPAVASVFGFTETSALAAARANEALRLPGNPHAAVAYLTDKATLRAKVNQLTGAPVRFERCDHAAHVVPTAERVGFPCVAKPRTGSGGQDVHLLRDAADAALLAAELNPEPALIVEEFLEGPEYSVEAHSRAGVHTVLAITRIHPPGAGPDAGGHDLPAVLDPATAAEIHALVQCTLGAAGQRSGPSQTEVVVTAHGPRLIESHAHPGDECVAELLAATGTDVHALTVASALGLPRPPGPPPSAAARHAGVRFLRLPPGLLTAVDGLEEARALPGVTGVEIGVPVGSHVPETTSRVAGHGRVTVVADSPHERDALLRKALGALRPVVVPEPLSLRETGLRNPVKEEEHSAA
ncbi:ATP-grasp domain-containing protein [Streptomyces avicenniae]|uniref:ATP-grasp domain-containing protein n=1 Tax=Streptomyces avicenniae TaxID=500153 RepID=UPI00069AA9AE|nr:ATP-grasp domain-containing protein [Streptomyces avicenniae]